MTSFDVPTHQPSLTQPLPPHLCHKAQAFHRTLLSEVLNTVQAARPCLILCRSIAMSHTLYQLIQPEVPDLRLLNDVQNEAEDFLVVNAGQSASVTIATNAAGRGTDIELSAKAAKNGGLHVIFTFFPHSERVEMQGAGRAGRQGNPGSYRMILPQDDEFLSKTGGDKMEALIALRQKRAEEASFTRRQHTAFHLAQHPILESFCNDLQNKFSTTRHRQAILNQWAEFYTDLENLPVDLAPPFETALLNYKNKLNRLYDHFIKSLTLSSEAGDLGDSAPSHQIDSLSFY